MAVCFCRNSELILTLKRTCSDDLPANRAVGTNFMVVGIAFVECHLPLLKMSFRQIVVPELNCFLSDANIIWIAPIDSPVA